MLRVLVRLAGFAFLGLLDSVAFFRDVPEEGPAYEASSLQECGVDDVVEQLGLCHLAAVYVRTL